MTDDKQRKAPVLRFKGFHDDWEQRKLGSKVNFYNGLTYHPDDVKELGTFVIRSNNVKNNQIIKSNSIKVSSNIINVPNVEKDDIVVVVRNGSKKLIGKHALINNSMPNTVIGAFMTGIRSNNNKFIKSLLDSSLFKKEIQKNLGATINQITISDFKNMKFNFPTSIEQNKIGNLILKIDKLLFLQQRKSYLCKCINHAINQQLFLKKDSWKKAILHKLVHIEDNKRIPVKESMRKKGLIPYYGANGIQDYVQGFTHNGKFILIAEDGANSLTNYPVIQVNGKIWVNNHSHVLQPDNRQVDINFLTLALKLINYQKYVVGGSRTKLNLEDLKNIIIYLPPLDLQNKIGNFYNQQKIQNKYLNNQILQLKHIKQFLLQNMFI